eukprot:31483-Pelagococcus_subviridis.AAC.14
MIRGERRAPGDEPREEGVRALLAAGADVDDAEPPLRELPPGHDGEDHDERLERARAPEQVRAGSDDRLVRIRSGRRRRRRRFEAREVEAPRADLGHRGSALQQLSLRELPQRVREELVVHVEKEEVVPEPRLGASRRGGPLRLRPAQEVLVRRDEFRSQRRLLPVEARPPPAAAALGVAPAGPSADDRHGEHEAGRHGWRSSPSRAPRTEEDLARVLRSSPVVTLKLALAPCRLVIARAPLARAPAAPRCVSRARP